MTTVRRLRMTRPVGGKAAHWNPSHHPRDRVGRFTDRPDLAVPPLSDEAYDAHVKQLQQQLDQAFKAGKATHRVHTKDGNGWSYTPKRAAQHKEIIDELMQRYADVPREGRAVISGGLGGAGKTTVLKQYADVDADQYATLNADDIKEIMAEKGMIPRTEGVAPLESASLVHEESRHVTLMLADALYSQKTNVIWDTTMNDGHYLKSLMVAMRKRGYGEIRGVFVDIPVETSVRRALARHREGLERWRNGDGHGGRFVPPHIIRRSESHRYPGSSHNRTVFERAKKYFDDWELWDNAEDGKKPQLLQEKGSAP